MSLHLNPGIIKRCRANWKLTHTHGSMKKLHAWVLICFKCFKPVRSFWVHAAFLLNTIHGKQKSRNPFCVCYAAISENEEQLRESGGNQNLVPGYFFFFFPDTPEFCESSLMWSITGFFVFTSQLFVILLHLPSVYLASFLVSTLTNLAECAYIIHVFHVAVYVSQARCPILNYWKCIKQHPME